MLIRREFRQQLQKIILVTNRSGIICSSNLVDVSEAGNNLLQQIRHYLSLVNITLVDIEDESIDIHCHLCAIGDSLTLNQHQNNNIYLLLEDQTDVALLSSLDYIDFTNKLDYYLALLLLLKKIINRPEIDVIIADFITNQNNLRSSFEGKTVLMPQTLDQNKTIKRKYKFVIVLVLLAGIVTSGFLLQKKSLPHILEIDGNSVATNKVEEWNLPSIIDHYTQRHEITNAIWQKLKQNDGKQVFIERKTAILAGLHGLGGVGKTTLAKHAIYFPQQQYSFKGWFSAETEELLQADYSELGEKYQLFTKDISVKQKISLVKEWLEKHQHVLLVYDNAPDMDILQEYLPNKGDIIITSRNYNVPGAIEVNIMTEDEAVKLLDNLAPQSAKKAANYNQDLKELAKTLGYLPLALSQAGAYINQNNLTIKDYLSLYDTEKDKLLSNKTMPAMDKHEPVYITWDLSIEKLKREKLGDKVLEMLNLIACCYPEYVPNKLLAQYLYNKTDNESIIKLNELLTLLRKYSLIKNSSDTISIHRLVHSWLGTKLSKERKDIILKGAAKSIKTIYQLDRATEDIDFVKYLLPHSNSVLIQLDETAGGTEYADLLFILGDNYYILGNYIQSKEMFKKSLDVNEKSYGKNSIEIARSLYGLGKVYISCGEYLEGEKLLTQSYKILQQYPTKETQIAFTLCWLGRIHIYEGNYKKSEKILNEALAIQKKDWGIDHEKTAYVLSDLGIIYILLGRYNESQNSLEKALQTRTNYHGLEHRRTAHTLQHLGMLNLAQGKYKESQTLLEKAQGIIQENYGSEHIQSAYVLGNLGNLYLVQGEYNKSKKLLQRALEITQKYYGQEHIVSAGSLESLGIYYLTLHDYDKAKELFGTAYGIISKLYENNNIFTIKSAANLANAHRLVKNLQESKELLEQSLILMEEFYDYDQVTIAKIIGNLGLLYGELGNNEKRKEYLEKALMIFKINLPDDHNDIKQTIINLRDEKPKPCIGYLIDLAILFP